MHYHKHFQCLYKSKPQYLILDNVVVQVDTCCFDKTGTLTSDFLTMRGMVLTDAQAQCEVVADSSEPVITSPQNISLEV